MTTNETKYQLLPDGSRQYPDGSIRNARGQLMKPHPDAAPPITSETARHMLDLRQQKLLEQTDRVLSPERVAKIVDIRAQVAETDKGHAGNQAASLVLKVAGHPSMQQGNQQQAPAPAIMMTEQGADALLQLAREARLAREAQDTVQYIEET